MLEMKTDLSTVLLLIDVQEGFDDPYWGKRNNPNAEANIKKALELFRANNLPVIHVQHLSTEDNSPLRPDRPGSALKEFARPAQGEKLIQKNVNSAFIGTDLEKVLRQMNCKRLIIAGLTSDHCVSTSTRMAGNFGFETYLLGDACATFDRPGPDGKVFPAQDIHDISMASLHNEFAQVIKTENLPALLSCEQICKS